ncbi:MAG: glycogen debranching enzyme family protein [Polyangiaceae bacterium]|nr:glycogen debranching enzyme family protein [Polyangiaceae bacterium]
MSRPTSPDPPRDGPWPRVQVDGDLERAGAEWLHTNGAGAYAMSTVSVMHTRRHHGLFVAALAPPLDRHVIVTHAEVSIEVGGRAHRISTHRFPGMAPTPGYRLLQWFAQDPIPRWVYRIGKAQFERKVALVRGRNALVVSHTWFGRAGARLTVRPLLSLRPVRGILHEHGYMVQGVSLRQGEVSLRPVPGVPELCFRHGGVFIGSPDWWRRFEYTDDSLREPSHEDLWTPGRFELDLLPGEPAYLTMSLGARVEAPAEQLLAETEAALLATDPGPERAPLVRKLYVAAGAFCALDAPRPAILAGYPFYDVRTRDVSVAAIGLMLARWRLDDAKRVLDAQVGELRSGLLPERWPEREGEVVVRSPDATLWLFEVARELADRTGAEDPFVRTRLYPALKRAFVKLRSGKTPGVWLTPDGAIANGDPEHALTWMSARAGTKLVTPRRGLAVELQALWTRACETLGALAREYEDEPILEATRAARDAARAAFAARFWCASTQYPYDCVSEVDAGPDAFQDASVRPNALLALAVDPSLFERWQAAAIVARVRAELLTPVGVRSLAPDHPDYFGVHVGPPQERESSFHQGTAWTWLVGSYARAALRLEPDDFELREELRTMVERALAQGPVVGQVAQLADGDAPHRPRGCPAQAWSVAEMLRTLVCELGM